MFRNRSQSFEVKEKGRNWQQWKAEKIRFPKLVLFLLYNYSASIEDTFFAKNEKNHGKAQNRGRLKKKSAHLTQNSRTVKIGPDLER